MIPLKVITEYSLLKSLIKLDNLFAFLKKNHINICGICDDDLFGVIDFYLKCKENGIKPIIGLEVLSEGKIFNLYAKNYLGYQNLIEINCHKKAEDFCIFNEKLDNLLVVIPYENINEYEKFSNKADVFLGYKNETEKKNVKLLTNNIVYINDIRCFKKEDIMYLEYLQMLGGKFEYNEESYFNINVSSEDIIYLEKFCKAINLEIPLNGSFVPDFKPGVNSDEYLRALAFKGLEKRFNGNASEEYKKRLEHELEVIKQMHFSNYFLIVYDYVLYAKKSNVLVGPGRGSAAGSLVSYVIGITNIDPIKYNLLFARFLNPSRKKMPDIDIDFENTKRMQVINYVKEKYGKDSVALGLTFNTYKSRLILRELAKVLDVDAGIFEKFIKNINSDKSLKENFENETIKKYISMYPEIKNVFNISLKLEGLKKNVSTHAAGVVISNEKLRKIIPIYEEDNINRTGVALDHLEKLGLLKMDFLALINLSTIAGVIAKLKDFKLENIPLDDQDVFEMFKTGSTDGIFQFESRYAKEALKKIKPENFEEIAIATALVRPGPSNEIDQYIKNKNSNVFNIHPDLIPVLESTQGVIIFQEQVMKITQIFPGYSEFEADKMRDIISKKNEKLIEEEEKKFIKKALEKGYEDAFVNDLFAKIKRFAMYGFNKSHAVSYALVAYQIAYLKVKYPVEFSLYNLENSKSDEDKKKYLSEIKKNSIKILKPNINVSGNEFKIKNNYLLLPLNMIKGLPENIIKIILERRENGYKDIFDFVTKCDEVMQKDFYETLVLSGVFDTFNINHHMLILNKEIIFNYASLKDELFAKPLLIEFPEYDDAVLRENEYKYYGIYLGNHPCSIYHDVVKIKSTKDYLFKNIKMCVLVEKISVIMTKNNEQMAFLDVSDETGDIQMTLFPETYKRFSDLSEGEIIFVEGKSSKRFDKYQIIVNNIKKKVK